MDGRAGPLPSRNQPHERPGGLAGGRLADSAPLRVIVAGDALAPTTVAVLTVDEPTRCAPHVGRLDVFADASEPAQHLPGAIDVVHAPAPVPASVGQLVVLQELDCARHYWMGDRIAREIT